MGRSDRSGQFDLTAAMERQDPDAGAESSSVAIIDRSRLRRECLKLALVQHNSSWHIVEFAQAEELLRLAAASEHFDLVLIGAATAEHVDLHQLEVLRNGLAETPIVVVAESVNPQRARTILAAGARGFLPASLSLKVLMGALDLVLAGGVYVPSSLIEGPQRQAIEGLAEGPVEPWADLTRRQRDVLGLISQGKSNKLIADALTMSESTVKAHVKQIIKRLHVANRTQAALLATGQGLFPPPTLGLGQNGSSGPGNGNGHALGK